MKRGHKDKNWVNDKCKLMSCFIDIYPWLIIKLHWPRKIAWCPDVSDLVAVMCKREDENKKNWFSEIEIQYWIDMMPCIHLLIFLTIESVEKGFERLRPRFARAWLTEGKTSFPKRRWTPWEGLWFERARDIVLSRPWLIIQLHWPRKIAWCLDVWDMVVVMCKREDGNKKNWFGEI